MAAKKKLGVRLVSFSIVLRDIKLARVKFRRLHWPVNTFITFCKQGDRKLIGLNSKGYFAEYNPTTEDMLTEDWIGVAYMPGECGEIVELII